MNDEGPTPMRDDEVLQWMALAADGALDDSTRRRLEHELAARPHLREAARWMEHLDELARTEAARNEESLPPFDAAALRARVIDRVSRPKEESALRSRGPGIWARVRLWAPAIVLVALVGVLSLQQLREDPTPREAGVTREIASAPTGERGGDDGDPAPPPQSTNAVSAADVAEDEAGVADATGNETPEIPPAQRAPELAKLRTAARPDAEDAEGAFEHRAEDAAGSGSRPIGLELSVPEVATTDSPRVRFERLDEAVQGQASRVSPPSSSTEPATLEGIHSLLARLESASSDQSIDEVVRQIMDRMTDLGSPPVSVRTEARELLARSRSVRAVPAEKVLADSIATALSPRLQRIDDGDLRDRVREWLRARPAGSEPDRRE